MTILIHLISHAIYDRIIAVFLCKVGCCRFFVFGLDGSFGSAHNTSPLKARTVEVVDSTVRLDSVAFPGKLVVVSGYEKPLRSTREALHVTNNDSTRLLKGGHA